MKVIRNNDKKLNQGVLLMKKIILVLFVSIMTVALVGCNSDENVIEFWTPLTGDDGTYMNELVDEYNEQSEQELEIKHVITSDMYTKLYTVMNSGSGIPDLTLIQDRKSVV